MEKKILIMHPVTMKVIINPPIVLNQSSIERLESLGIVGEIMTPHERHVVLENVMQCSICGGIVDKCEYVFECRDCFAMGDFMTGIMNPHIEKEVFKK